ncbi:MAG: RNA polymerase sigma factor RpoD/SigA [Treponema sp.]|jgi:RNA polymerase primary sigma factor|nr:RNA polymerase sigma factor RpoD/SigA [Treponema sp.]
MTKKTKKSGDDLLEMYFRQIKGFALLTFKEELELSKQIQTGSTKALHKLVNSNLRLVVKIAGMFNVRDVPILDMIQEGNLGLIRAAEKFDYRKNVCFCTYANWWIRHYISRFISDKRRIVRLPRRKEETLLKIQRTYHVLSQTLMHQPNNTDIAEELGISVQDVDYIVNLTSSPLHLEPVIKDDESGGTVDIHEDYTYCPERNLFKQFSRDGTLRVLNKLKEREKQILNYRYKLNGCERFSYREIGDKLDMSRETVRQIEMRALKKMRIHANELKECVYVEAM